MVRVIVVGVAAHDNNNTARRDHQLLIVMSTNRTKNMSGLTTSLIPCCTCGAIIAPNPSNQCASCLATVDIGAIIRRGPGGGDLTIYQCRQCRKFDTGDGRHYMHLGEESPELMA